MHTQTLLQSKWECTYLYHFMWALTPRMQAHASMRVCASTTHTPTTTQDTSQQAHRSLQREGHVPELHILQLVDALELDK